MKEKIYTYKFRLYPNKEQETYLTKVFGCCRLVYNYFLSEKQTQYKNAKTSDNYNAQQHSLTELRKKNECIFLNEIPLQSLQCSLRNMHNVCGIKNPEVKNLNIRNLAYSCCDSTHDRDINAAKNILKYKSVRNIDNSREAANKPNEKSVSISDCSDNGETIKLFSNRTTSTK